MKPKLKNYISLFFDMLVKRPAKKVASEVRYQFELGGEDGYKVNGIGEYWGRYASLEKIVELARTMKGEDDWFTFEFPAMKYNFKFSHQIGIHWVGEEEYIELEFHESSNQCGSYYKKVALVNLENELRDLREVEKAPEEHGFTYQES